MSTLDVSAFQSAFGRLCDVSAQALANGVERDEVRRAFAGLGPVPFAGQRHREALQLIRAHRQHVNQRVELVKHYATRHGVSDHDRTRAMVEAGRLARTYAEVEWMVKLPIVDPNP